MPPVIVSLVSDDMRAFELSVARVLTARLHDSMYNDHGLLVWRATPTSSARREASVMFSIRILSLSVRTKWGQPVNHWPLAIDSLPRNSYTKT
eukprot:637005-Amphidinium_carterae.1